MIIFIVRDLRGAILGAYDNERAARTHLEALVVRSGWRGEWRDYALYVNDIRVGVNELYAGRIESVEVRTEYERERER